MHHAQFLVICQLCWIERLDHSLKCRRDQPNVQLSVPSDNRLSYRIERAFHRNMFDLSSELEADVAVDGAELLNELLEGGHAAAVHHKDDTSSSNQLSRFGLACTIDELEAESASHPANIGMALLANEIKLATGINSYSGSSKGQLPSGTTAATYPWMEHQPQPQPLVYEVIPKGATQKVRVALPFSIDFNSKDSLSFANNYTQAHLNVMRQRKVVQFDKTDTELGLGGLSLKCFRQVTNAWIQETVVDDKSKSASATRRLDRIISGLVPKRTRGQWNDTTLRNARRASVALQFWLEVQCRALGVTQPNSTGRRMQQAKGTEVVE